MSLFEAFKHSLALHPTDWLIALCAIAQSIIAGIGVKIAANIARQANELTRQQSETQSKRGRALQRTYGYWLLLQMEDVQRACASSKHLKSLSPYMDKMNVEMSAIMEWVNPLEEGLSYKLIKAWKDAFDVLRAITGLLEAGMTEEAVYDQCGSSIMRIGSTFAEATTRLKPLLFDNYR